MSFSKILGVVILASVIGCKKEPEKPAGRPPAERVTKGPAPIISPVNFESGSTTITPGEAAAIEEAAQIEQE